MSNIFSKIFVGIACTFAGALLFISNAQAEEAVTLTPVITLSNGGSVYDMSDTDYYTRTTFNAGDTISVSCDTEMAAIYMCWNNRYVEPWTLTTAEGNTQHCGEKGYIHEYVKLDKPTKSFTITIPVDGACLTKFSVFSEGEKQAWVQDWDEPCDTADIMLVSTHADDEQIFFGGIIPYYGGELGLKVQIVYFANYWNGENTREHEKLDGLWHVGVRHYPVMGDFDDLYCTDYESALTVYNYNDVVKYMVDNIRRFKPLVLVGQDLNGEYGHGAHCLTANALAEAIDYTNNAEKFPESATQYGTYEVPKTYLHLYPENSIDLDCRRPLSNFGGKTVLEVASEGYLQHESQQWCWFYVSDDYQYSCGRYGLYRSNVGADTEADLMCNLTTYEELESIKAEEESIKQSEAESIAKSEAENTTAATLKEDESSESAHNSDQSDGKKIFFVLMIVVAAIIIILLGMFIYANSKARANRKRRKREIKK